MTDDLILVSKHRSISDSALAFSAHLRSDLNLGIS